MNEINEAIDFIKSSTSIFVIEDAQKSMRGMWRGIRLDKGVLYVNPSVAHPGDLLHEAGHVALSSRAIRPFMSGKLDDEAYLAEYGRLLEIDWEKAVGCDMAATMWAFSVCKYLGLNTELAFQNGFGANWKELHIGCVSGIGSSMGSIYSTQLYYLGLLGSKADWMPLAWEVEE